MGKSGLWFLQEAKCQKIWRGCRCITPWFCKPSTTNIFQLSYLASFLLSKAQLMLAYTLQFSVSVLVLFSKYFAEIMLDLPCQIVLHQTYTLWQDLIWLTFDCYDMLTIYKFHVPDITTFLHTKWQNKLIRKCTGKNKTHKLYQNSSYCYDILFQILFNTHDNLKLSGNYRRWPSSRKKTPVWRKE